MKVNEIMSRHPVTVSPDQTLAEAATIMERISSGFLPVGEDDHLVGTLTDRDIAVRGVAAGLGPQTQVREVMNRDVRYCYEDDEVAGVAANMGEQQVRRMPVVNRDKRLVGVVSVGDLAIGAGATTAGDALEQIAQPGGPHS